MKKAILFLWCMSSLSLLSCGSDGESTGSLPDIPVYEIKAQEIDIYQEFVGQLYGYKDIAIRARVEGFLEGIHFQEGSRLITGKKLYTIESQPFEADVAAKMSRLAETRTMLAKAESDLNRIKPLAEQNAVSQSDLDAAVAQYDASVASVEAAQANLRASRIQLSYTQIYSPIDGIIGKTQAKVGDFVGRSPNPVILNVVSRIDTVLVQFFITERQYLTVARFIQTEGPMLDDDRENQFRLILVDGSILLCLFRLHFPIRMNF
jgi:membrane fusion protein (multidrug efflux system)